MKVIDLLNKIANGEELPKKIRYEYKDYVYKDNYEDYYCEEESRYLFETIVHDENWKLSYAMNIGVEILEEEKKIPEETTVSEEQMLFNNLTTIDQEYVIRFMRMLQPPIMDYLKSKGE